MARLNEAEGTSHYYRYNNHTLLFMTISPKGDILMSGHVQSATGLDSFESKGLCEKVAE